MSDFIINTVTHKRWWLPDRRHQYDSILFGDCFRIAILDALDGGRIVDSHVVKIDGPEGQWKNLLELSQELANRKYGRRHNRLESFEHRYSGSLGSKLGRI